MKKIMPLAASIALILIAGIFASAGSLAWFSDTDTSEGNVLSAGTLYLESYTGSDGEMVMFTVSDVVPGYEKGVDNSKGYEYVNFYIWGSIQSELDIALSAITNEENTLEEPEIEAGDETPNKGELGDYMEVAIWVHNPNLGRDGKFRGVALYPDGTIGSEGPSYYPLNEYSDVSWDAVLQKANPGTWRCFCISWRIPGSAGNVIQSDSVTFTVTFVLEQPEAD